MIRGRLLFSLLALVPLACGGGGGGGDGGGRHGSRPAPLVLAAGAVGLEADADGTWAEGLDLTPLGVERIDAAYDLTTPPGETFAFDVLSRAGANTGSVRVALAHALDDGAPPAGGPETLAEAGIVPGATGAAIHGDWLTATGDGFARITVKGSIDREQVIAVRTETEGEETTAVVRVRPGPDSAINVAAGSGGDYPGVLDHTTLYSSDSWSFGLPTIAVSGDRTSVVCYEGDRQDPDNPVRYEMRLQHEAASGRVTGGASLETSPDSGHWRDHEIAALYNVLALVNSGGALTVRLSFDRGASFTQEEVLDRPPRGYRARLVNLAMAADYTLAIAWWRALPNGASELLLVMGTPAETDEFGSPTRFDFGPPEVVHRARGDVTPLLFSLAFSEGGDLAIGYAFTSFLDNGNRTWTNLTQNRCAVRLYGGEFTDTLVEEDRVVGRDPSVSLVGKGRNLRIFYAYEARDGVRLAVSDDAGKTFSVPQSAGSRSAMSPTVLARTQGGATRVDLLYLAGSENGTELHLRHWDDFGKSPWGDFRLTTAKRSESRDLPRDAPVPGADRGTFVPDVGYRITEIAWFGYDAVLDGDDVVVVYDEQTYDALTICRMPPNGWLEGAPVPLAGADRGFTAAEPPPLAPGLTEPVPAPDPDDMHQLKLLRLN